jgi:hypothetical protein
MGNGTIKVYDTKCHSEVRRSIMESNVIFFGWNRSLAGREQLSSDHFNDFVEYLGGLHRSGSIESFDTVFLEPHGGDLNGFFLIRGDSASLDSLIASEEWSTHMVRAGMHLDRSGSVRGFTGESVITRMKLWNENIPT